MHSLENAKNFKIGLLLASNNKNFPIKFHAPDGFFPMFSFIYPCERVKKESAHTSTLVNCSYLQPNDTDEKNKTSESSARVNKIMNRSSLSLITEVHVQYKWFLSDNNTSSQFSRVFYLKWMRWLKKKKRKLHEAIKSRVDIHIMCDARQKYAIFNANSIWTFSVMKN